MFQGRFGLKDENSLRTSTSSMETKATHATDPISPVSEPEEPGGIREIGMAGAPKMENPVTGDMRDVEGFVGR